MPAKNERQRRLFGAALAYKEGRTKKASAEVKKLAGSTSLKVLRDYARKK